MQDTDVVTDISNMVFLAGAAAAEASEASDSAAAALLAEGAPDVKPPTKRECVDVVVYTCGFVRKRMSVTNKTVGTVANNLILEMVYRVRHQLRDYILLTKICSFTPFCPFVLCPFCQISTYPSRIGQMDQYFSNKYTKPRPLS